MSQELAYDHKPAPPRKLVKTADPAVFRKHANYPTPRLPHPVRKIVFSIRSHDQGWAGQTGEGEYRGSYTWFDAGLEKFESDMNCKLRNYAPCENISQLSIDNDAGEPMCVPDVRYESVTTEAPGLPNCALRSIQPPLRADAPENAHKLHEHEGLGPATIYYYEHPLLSTEKYLIQKNKTASKRSRTYRVTWSYLDDTDPESIEGIALADMGRGSETATGEFVRNLELGDMVTIWGKARFPGWVNVVEKAKVEIFWAV